VLYFSGSMCAGVVRLGWCGILMQAEAVNGEIIKRVTSSWSILIQLHSYVITNHNSSVGKLISTSLKTRLRFQEAAGIFLLATNSRWLCDPGSYPKAMESRYQKLKRPEV